MFRYSKHGFKSLVKKYVPHKRRGSYHHQWFYPAIHAYHSSTNQNNSMAPVKRKHGHFTSGPHSHKRGLGWHMQHPRKRRHTGYSTFREVADENPDRLERAVSKHVGKKKRINAKKAKNVKVTKKFVAKVHKALIGEKHHGFKKDYYYGSWKQSTVGAEQLSNIQYIDKWVTGGSGAVPFWYSQWSFLPEYFLDAASVLWNAKTASAGGSAGWRVNTTKTIGQQNPYTTGSDFDNVQFFIKKSYEDWLFKNVTTRTIKVKLYHCRPKRASFLSDTPIDMTTQIPVITGFNLDALIDPHTWWTRCLQVESAENINISAANPSTLDMDPRMCSEFNKNWVVDVTEYVVDPGVSFKKRLIGPSNFEWKFKNHVQVVSNTAYPFYDIQKYSQYLMAVVIPDLAVASSTGAPTNFAGRMPFISTVYNKCLVVERKLYCSLEMPEQAGWNDDISTPTMPKVLGHRRNAWAWNNWGVGNGSEPTVITDVERNVGHPET